MSFPLSGCCVLFHYLLHELRVANQSPYASILVLHKLKIIHTFLAVLPVPIEAFVLYVPTFHLLPVMLHDILSSREGMLDHSVWVWGHLQIIAIFLLPNLFPITIFELRGVFS